jgi:hypothetical protein
MFQSNRAAHATGSAAAATLSLHSDPDVERLVRRSYWPDYAVLDALGVAAPQTSQPGASGARSDRLRNDALRDALAAPQSLGSQRQPPAVADGEAPPSAAEPLAGATGRGAVIRPGPFGGASGDGVNRDRGSFRVKPPPPVVPAYAFSEAPVLGERWDLQALIEGFGPAHGP